jgi:tryptophan 2,3-dioxygenase
VQFRAIEAASGLRESQFMNVLQEHGEVPPLVKEWLARPTLQDLFLALLRAQKLELETLYTGERPTTLFFLAEALLEYEQQFGQWRFKHVQLVERVLGPLTSGTGGTLGSKYLARTIDQKFFPALWAVRAKFYGAPAK